MNTSFKNISYSILASGIHLLYTYLIKPKKHTDEEKRHEFILNIILTGICVITLCLLGDLVYNSIMMQDAYIGLSVVTFSSICAFFIILLILSRRGHVRVSAYILIAFSLGITTYCQIRWGASLPSALLGDALIITMSTLLIGRGFGIIMSLGIGMILIMLAYREGMTHVIALWKSQPINIGTGIQHAMILCSITILSWLYSREIEQALTRALASETALQEKNDSLEHIVEQRTQALKLAQIEKNVQLYRFVEFGKLSAGIFHDILNPLTVVALNMQSLQSSCHGTMPEIQGNITQAVNASKRMERFVATIKKQIQVNDILSHFSLNNEIEEVLLLFTHKALCTQVSLDFKKGDDVTYFGNPMKFHQIIANLVSNAIDAYRDMKKLNGPRPIYIEIQKKHTSIDIVIRDKGVGMSEETIKSIFEPFFTTKQQGGQGIGLGLSSTKHIIEKNFNGSIRVKSQLGRGTTFIISLPQNTPHDTLTTDT